MVMMVMVRIMMMMIKTMMLLIMIMFLLWVCSVSTFNKFWCLFIRIKGHVWATETFFVPEYPILYRNKFFENCISTISMSTVSNYLPYCGNETKGHRRQDCASPVLRC